MASRERREEKDAKARLWHHGAKGAIVAFAMTFLLLGGTTTGSSTAGASDPPLEAAAAGNVVRDFQANLTGGGINVGLRPRTEAQLSGVDVEAQLDQAGQTPTISLSLRNGGGTPRDVSCVVAVERVTHRPGSEFARMMPPPEIERLVAVEVSEALAPGQSLDRILPLESLAEGPGFLRVAIEEI